METAVETKATDECYRCGYALLGIADDQPCPECGLLAGRSRRPTDELHNTRPRWLRRIALGAWLVLLVIPFVPVWAFLMEPVEEFLEDVPLVVKTLGSRRSEWTVPLLGFYAAAGLLLAAAFLLTAREGYAPADRADRRRRTLLRVAAAAPLAALALLHLDEEVANAAPGGPWSRGGGWQPLQLAAIFVATVGCAPLPLLLFRQLRNLAGRARSAHLAEHCTIVGLGTSLTLVYVAACILLVENAERLGLGPNWATRSDGSLVVVLILLVAGTLFPLWSVYLLLSFAVAFRRAARRLRGQWARDDRSGALRPG